MWKSALGRSVECRVGQVEGEAATSFATEILTFRCGYWKIAAAATVTGAYVCNCLACVVFLSFDARRCF